VRVRCSTGRAAATGQEHSTSRTPQRERKAARVKAGSGVVTVSPHGGHKGPVGGNEGSLVSCRFLPEVCTCVSVPGAISWTPSWVAAQVLMISACD